MHFICLLDDQTFEFISTYPFDTFEYGCSILRCSFSNDSNVYYCVGTAYVLPKENEPTKGRILVFIMEDGKLQLIAEKETKGSSLFIECLQWQIACCYQSKNPVIQWQILDDDIYLGAENNFNLFTVRKNSERWFGLMGGMDGGNGSLIDIFILEFV
ncbi:hypothetical protein Pint_25303 [Pistacia integerrima]|uniref:Uncharacterized protein n=1 Tax=Pistacia integerrima TaxID=434235 RepID=A0ACC0YD81_9ROSI|nr:hypothetical protein Pint_25303 [Pistacia integerrima]